MAKADPEREERRRQQTEIAESLRQSGALDEIFARMDAGEPLNGHEGLLKGMLKATLERSLNAELSDHLGHDSGDPDAAMFPNSRTGQPPRRSRRRSAMSSWPCRGTVKPPSARCWFPLGCAAWTDSTR